MDWKKERDLLVAQTLAFVQSVSGNKPNGEALADATPKVAAALIATIERATAIVGPPEATPIHIQIPQMIAESDVRAEIHDRIANFRAHQQRFHREREEYFSTTLARARAAIADDLAPLP
jgi:hypothetical protein